MTTKADLRKIIFALKNSDGCWCNMCAQIFGRLNRTEGKAWDHTPKCKRVQKTMRLK